MAEVFGVFESRRKGRKPRQHYGEIALLELPRDSPDAGGE
jgi:hypothetical protein